MSYNCTQQHIGNWREKAEYFWARLFLFTGIVCLSNSDTAQNFNVPDSILKELKTEKFIWNDSLQVTYKINYPTNAKENVPLFIGMSGGPATEEIVNFCYYTIFRSDFIQKKYITILPVSTNGTSLLNLDSTLLVNFLSYLTSKKGVSSNGWLLAGTSYGGIATFDLAKSKPELFEGIICMPGGLYLEGIPNEWKNYKVLLAIGEKDIQPFEQGKKDNWYTVQKNTQKRLKRKGIKVITYIMKDQEHIILPGYDINNVYRQYFKK